MVPALICAEIVCSIYDYVLGSQKVISIKYLWTVGEKFKNSSACCSYTFYKDFLTNMACASVLTLASHFQNPNSPPGDALYVSHDSVPHTVAVATSGYGREKKKMIWWQNANGAAESQSWPLNNVGRGENGLVPCEKRKWSCHPCEKRPAREVAGCHAAVVLITIPFSISLMTR